MRRTFHSIALAALLLPAGLAAQGVRVAVDRPEATLEDQLVLSVTVEGSREARPALPDLPAFEVVEGGSSTQVRIVNGQMTASVSYSFLLVPREVGSFQIGPVSAEIDGKIYRSRPFTVKILDPGSQPRQARDAFLSAKVSNPSPYVGEQVIYTWRFYRRVQVADAQLQPQDFAGIPVEDLGDLREYETTVRGQAYLVSEFKKALFPQEPGEVTIPGTQLTCQLVMRSQQRRGSLFDDFFSRPRTAAKVLRSDAITLDVKPRPAPPAGFGGLVGTFTISGKISKRELQVGESATLETTVSGSGNAHMITPPSFPELSEFKIYDDKPTGSVQRRGDGLRGSRTFHRAVVPLQEGEVVLPPTNLTFFDPSSGSYRTVSTDTIRLTVLPAEGREELNLTESLAPTTGKVAVRILADDILPVHTALRGVTPTAAWLSWPGWLVSLLLPPMAFLLLVGVQRRKQRVASDRGFRRRRQALRQAVNEIERLAKESDPAQQAELASRCVRGYIGNALDLEGTALTPSEAESLLREHGVPEETVGRVHRLLSRLEATRYGAGAAPADASSLVEGIRPLLKELDGRIRR